jgi:hypothetical protein
VDRRREGGRGREEGGGGATFMREASSHFLNDTFVLYKIYKGKDFSFSSSNRQEEALAYPLLIHILAF